MNSMNYIIIYRYYFLLNLLCFPLITFDISPFCCCCNQSGSYQETRYTITHSEKIIHTSTTTGDNENIDYTNFKQIYNFKNGNKYIDDKCNFYYNKLLEKYLAGRKVDSIIAEPIESLGKCFKVKINNSDVVYVKKDKKENKFYIDLLKELDYCELEYIYEGDYILTKEVQNDIDFGLYLNNKTIKKVYNTFSKTTNLLPYFTIAAFLRLQDCGIKLNNSQFKKINNDQYIVKALDIDIYDDSQYYKTDVSVQPEDIKSYNDFYIVLNGGFRSFGKIKRNFLELYEYNNEPLKEFYYFIVYGNYTELNEMFSDLPENKIDKLNKEQKNAFSALNKIFFMYNLVDYLKYKNFINDEVDYISYDNLQSIFRDKFKNDIKAFIIDYLLFFNGNEKFTEEDFDENDFTLLSIEKQNDIYETAYLFIAKLFEMSEKSFDIFFKFEKLWNCFADYIKEINEEQKKEIILKFKQMLDFLIKNNNSSDQNIKSSIKKIKTHICKVKNANLFEFIFTNDEIISKLNQLGI